MFQRNPFGQIIAVLSQQGIAPRTKPYNPHPAGVLWPDGASVAVLKFLKQHPDQWFAFDQLAKATGRSLKSLDWACIQLRRMSLIATRENPANCRYFEYRFLDDGGQL